MTFKILKKDKNTNARLGKLKLRNATVDTPVFMPVGTNATVKTISTDELNEMDNKIILSNVYHLFLRPGIDIIKSAGGLHKFMNWKGSILTDSGGYQVYSLAKLNKINDAGAFFQSHIDGKKICLTPEIVVDFQNKLGSDIMMVLDECVKHDAPKKKTLEAKNRTTLWAKRSKDYFINCVNNDQQLWPIIQGGLDKKLRMESTQELLELDMPGYAIGGLSIGEPYNITFEILDVVISQLTENKPRYFMGLGSAREILESVKLGIDMFDSVLPTRVARNGLIMTESGNLHIKNSHFSNDMKPLSENCKCKICKSYSRAYIKHLFMTKEILGLRFASYHNLYFLSNFLKEIRESIAKEKFNSFYKEKIKTIKNFRDWN